MALLDLAYDAAIPRSLLREMERAGRSLGLPLRAMEALGQSADRCRAFVRAARVHDLRAMRAVADSADIAATRPVLMVRVPGAQRAWG
jgi:hypothetical protein